MTTPDDTNHDLDTRHERIRATLREHDQEHLLAFYDDLDDVERRALLDQLEDLDWRQLDRLIESHVRNHPAPDDLTGLEPAPAYPKEPTEDLRELYGRAREVGERLIREGRVAAFTVAGGQGTRLGWDGPKGTFPATPVEGKPLFRVFAEYLRRINGTYGVATPWYIMTSPINDEATRAFFVDNDYFGLAQGDVMFFQQGTMPSFDPEGKILLAEPSRLALSPDGHGGSLRALHKSGALDDMRRRGVRIISYFQVDNPNVKCIDPLFIGLHEVDGAQMSSKMLPKAAPKEKVGNFVRKDGRIQIIEYSDMPDELAQAREPDGGLRFNAGSIAIHVISTDFVRALNESDDGFGLPFHRADKKVPYIDPASGERVEPTEPNAVKLEAFVFDALPLAERSIILEADRVEEFAPIKNASGTDSPETSRQLQSQRAARWLAAAGVDVPFRPDGSVDAVIELSHLTAIEPSDLRQATLPDRIERGRETVL